jgi:hypothetical protein
MLEWALPFLDLKGYQSHTGWLVKSDYIGTLARNTVARGWCGGVLRTGINNPWLVNYVYRGLTRS